jgi:hypothetical protein
MPDPHDLDTARARSFISSLARLTPEGWKRIVARYDGDDDLVTDARLKVNAIIKGEDLRLTEYQRLERKETIQDTFRVFEHARDALGVPENAVDAAKDALRAMLVYDYLQGMHEAERRILLAPFEGILPGA